MRKYVLLVLLLWAAKVSTTHAAVSPDAFDTFSATSSGTSFTKVLHLGTDADRGLYVMVRTVNGNSVSSLTWNGTALSPVADSLIEWSPNSVVPPGEPGQRHA